MAGLTRKTSIPFGFNGPTSDFSQFGSKEAGTPQTSKDPAVIQALSARWSQGWQTAVVSGDKAAYIEDMNGFCFVDSWQISYILQMGIPEWDSGTLYFTGSVVQTASSGQQFRSLQGGVPGAGAGQSGNTPPVSASNAFWQWLNPPVPGVDGQVLFNSSGIFGADSNLFWDNTNKRLGVDTNTPGFPLSVNGIVQSLVGGFKFPDGSVQTTASTSTRYNSSGSISTGFSVGSTVSIPHGLGATPFLWSITLRNVTPELGYSAGDEILYVGGFTSNSSTTGSVSANATNLVASIGSAIIVCEKNVDITAAITPGFWVMVGRATL